MAKANALSRSTARKSKPRKPAATGAAASSTDNRPAAPAGPAPEGIAGAYRAAKENREAERQKTQKLREAAAQEQVAIFRLHELPDIADPEKAGEIIIGAANILRDDSAGRKRLVTNYETTGGDNHYEDERRCILWTLLDACDPNANAAEIGEQFQTVRKLFSVDRLRSLDRLRSALQMLVDVFPRRVREEQARQVAETFPPKPKPASVIPPVQAILPDADEAGRKNAEAPWPPDDGWHFEPGLFYFGRRRYDLTALPLKLLQLFVTSHRASLTATELYAAWPNDPPLIPDNLRPHLTKLREALRRVAADIGAAGDVARDPIPSKGGGWQFLLPKQ